MIYGTSVLILSVSSMYILTDFPYNFLLCQFLHPMSMVPYWQCIPILWMGSRGNKTGAIHITGWGRIGKLFPIWILVVVVLWVPPSNFTYLFSLLYYYVLSYTAKTVPPVWYNCVCLHFSTFYWPSSYLIPPNLPLVRSQGIYCFIPHKYSIVMICYLLGMSFASEKNDPHLLS